MPTLQSQFMQMTQRLTDPAGTTPDQLTETATRLRGWMTLNCQQARPYSDAPAGTQGTVITFTDGTAVTVVNHERTPTLEIHRGKCHNYCRRHWLQVVPNGPPARNYLQTLGKFISPTHQPRTSRTMYQAKEPT